MPPSIDEIPAASQLQQQWQLLNDAIAGLAAGSSVSNLTITAPPPAQGETFTMPILVILDPPISDATTLADLTTQLQAQADAIEAQLTQMGYAPPASSTLSTRQHA